MFCIVLLFSTFIGWHSSFFSSRFRVRCRTVASSNELQWLARAESDHRRAFCIQNPGRLVKDFWRDRRLCYARVDFWTSELTPTQPGKGLFHEGLQRRRKPPAVPSSLPDPCRALPCSRPGHRGTHVGGAPGARVLIIRDWQVASCRGCRVWSCQSKAVEKVFKV